MAESPVRLGTMSERIAEFAHDLTLGDVPEPVRALARSHLLDGLGTALAATNLDFGRSIHDTAKQLGHGDESHVIGFGTAMPASSAALANGTLIHGLDFDDTHIGAIYHATAPSLAATLAVAEEQGTDGESALLAYILGLEIGCRVARVGAGRFHDRGFHPTGIAGAFAAAVVAGRLRRQSIGTIVNALGLCGSQGAGILEVRESWLKRFHPGWAAHAGLIASTAAGAGFLGPASVFEGPRGLFASHLGEAPEVSELGLDDLGSRWMTADIAVKPYPCCHMTHAFIDGARDILTELRTERLEPDAIDRIECPVAPRMMRSVTEPAEVKIAPQTLYQALFSVQYAVALTLVRGGVDLAAFYDEPLDNPSVLAVAEKVVCPPDTESDYPAHFTGDVTVHLRDGRSVHKRIPDSRGSSQWPMTRDEVTAKFESNARRALPAENVPSIVRTINGIESVADISMLLHLATRIGDADVIG